MYRNETENTGVAMYRNETENTGVAMYRNETENTGVAMYRKCYKQVTKSTLVILWNEQCKPTELFLTINQTLQFMLINKKHACY